MSYGDEQAESRRLHSILKEGEGSMGELTIRRTSDPKALEALHRLFFILERLDNQAHGGLPFVQVTSIMWRDQISPDIRLVRAAIDSEKGGAA